MLLPTLLACIGLVFAIPQPNLKLVNFDEDFQVHSQNWPNAKYPANHVQRVMVMGDASDCENIRLHFDSPFGVDCSDLLQIIGEDQLDSASTKGCSVGLPMIAQVCGDAVPEDIVFDKQNFMIEFCTNGNGEGVGYGLEIMCEEAPTTSPRPPGECGMPDPKYPVTDLQKIIGGNHANAHSWPWNAAVFVNIDDEIFQNCGGSLINENWVLTTSSCYAATPDQYRVKLGGDDIGVTWDVNEPSQQSIEITDFITHPLFDPSYLHYDIALLKLKTPAVMNEFVKPVCLPEPMADIPVGAQMAITGWGQTDPDGEPNEILYQTRLTVVSTDVCQRDYDDAGVPIQIDDSQVCAGPTASSDQGICFGDSGDPLMIEKDGKWTIDAVGSFGGPCFAQGLPSGAARVTYVMDWIQQTIDNN